MVSYPNFLQVYFKDFEVLILIVVEDGLVPLEFAKLMVEAREVLILVVVEDGLVLDLIRHY